MKKTNKKMYSDKARSPSEASDAEMAQEPNKELKSKTTQDDTVSQTDNRKNTLIPRFSKTRQYGDSDEPQVSDLSFDTKSGNSHGLRALDDGIYDRIKSIVSDVRSGFDRATGLAVNKYTVGVVTRIYLEEYIERIESILDDMDRLKKFIDPLSVQSSEKDFDDHIKELDLGDLSQTDLTEQQKTQIHANQEISRLSKRKREGASKLSRIKYLVTVMLKGDVGNVFTTVSDKYNSVFCALVHQEKQDSGEAMREMLRSCYNRDCNYNLDEVEIQFRRSEKDRGYKVIERASERFAEELSDKIFNDLECLAIEALSTNKQKFEELFYSIDTGKRVSHKYDRESFISSIIDNILGRAKYLLSYFISHIRENGMSSAWIGIQKDKLVLEMMGIDMVTNKHPGDDTAEKVYNIASSLQKPSPIYQGNGASSPISVIRD